MKTAGDDPRGGSTKPHVGVGAFLGFMRHPLVLAMNATIVGGWIVLSMIYLRVAPASVRPTAGKMVPILFGQALLLEIGLASAGLAVVLLARGMDRRQAAERIVLLLGGVMMLGVCGAFLMIAAIMTFPQY